MSHPDCKVCNAKNTDEQEAVGLLAVDGEISWEEAKRRLDLPNPKGLQNHMAKHYVAPPSEADVALEEFPQLIADSIKELTEQMAFAPPEVKPFYAIAIKNLSGLDQTKPSQQNLIYALKGIHEVTGMKQEQRLMLEFARHHFGLGSGAAKAAIEQHADVIEGEVVEDSDES